MLLATDSLFTVALAVVLLGERMGGRVAVALRGRVRRLCSAVASQRETMSTLSGDALVVAAAGYSAAVYAVLARRVVAGRNALSLTAEQMLGAVVALPLAAVMIAAGHGHLTHADAGHLLVTMTVALLSSVQCRSYLQRRDRRHRRNLRGATFFTLVPLFGALASVVLLGEHLAAAQLAGGAFVVVAAGLATIGVDAERAISA